MEDVDKKKLETLRVFMSMVNDGLTKEEFLKAFREVVNIVTRIGTKMVSENQQMRLDFIQLEQKLKDNNSSDLEEIRTQAQIAVGNAISDIISRVENSEDSIRELNDSKPSEEAALIAKIKEMLPTIDEMRADLPTMGPAIRDALELLQDKDRLDITAIRGMEELMEKIDAAQKNGGNLRIVGARSGFLVYINGVKEGMLTNVNFAAGSGMTISYSKVNGQPTITFVSSGGAGSTVNTPVEAVGGGNTLFTVTGQPQWVVADGVTYFEGAGYSYNSGTSKITLFVAPTLYIRYIL